MRLLTALVLVVLSFYVQARPVMTITCTEPSGPRTDYYGGKFEDKKDGFDSVTPTFIFDDEKPEQVTVIFGPAKWVKDAGYDPGAFEATVLLKNSEQITMIASTGTHIGQMYSIFPEKGIGYFTLHKYLPFEGGVASTATLISKCKLATK
jgi:hypothetical protein